MDSAGHIVPYKNNCMQTIGAMTPLLWLEGNFDGDEDIDITDFNFLANHFAPEGDGASAVPESSVFLASLAVILLASFSVLRRTVSPKCPVV